MSDTKTFQEILELAGRERRGFSFRVDLETSEIYALMTDNWRERLLVDEKFLPQLTDAVRSGDLLKISVKNDSKPHGFEYYYFTTPRLNHLAEEPLLWGARAMATLRTNPDIAAYLDTGKRVVSFNVFGDDIAMDLTAYGNCRIPTDGEHFHSTWKLVASLAAGGHILPTENPTRYILAPTVDPNTTATTA